MFKRAERVQELLRQEISTYLQTLTLPQLGFVTITGVEIGADLMDAKVFFSVYGSEEERQQSWDVLKKLIPDMRGHLGKKLESLYRAPNLQFVYDYTPERAQRVVDLLNKISKEREGGVPADAAAAGTRAGKQGKPRKKKSGKKS